MTLFLLMDSFVVSNSFAATKAYGIFDAGVSLINNGSEKSLALTSGTGTAARLGVRGDDVIDGRLSTEFLIETFITMDDGSNYGLGTSFNSSTFVGLKYKNFFQFPYETSEITLRFGRQRSVLHDRLYLYDPMRQNLIGSPTGFALYSMFYDKMIKVITKIKSKKELLIARFMFVPGRYFESPDNEYIVSNKSNLQKTPFGSWGVSLRWDRAPFSMKLGFQTEEKTHFRPRNTSSLFVMKYRLNQINYYGGYLLREPGRQLFNYNEKNLKTDCYYLGLTMPVKKLINSFSADTSLFVSYARPTMTSEVNYQVSKQRYKKHYYADQWGVGLKHPLSKKTAIFLFAGKLQNNKDSNFSLEAIPFDIPTSYSGDDPSVFGFSLNQRY